MINIPIILTLYKFSELDLVPQARAILSHKHFLLREYKFNGTQEEVIADIENNIHWYFKDGDQAVTEAEELIDGTIKETIIVQQKIYIIK